MAYKRVEFRTRSGKTVFFRTRAKTGARVKVKSRTKKKEHGSKSLAKKRLRGRTSLNAWGYGRVM